MPHIFFFSYSSHDWNLPGLREFYADLCKEVASLVRWDPDSKIISFRDHEMRLGEEWKPAIATALQESVVLVSIVSEAYFSREFCGQEVYIFDQRRRQGMAAGAESPPVILPVVWAPVKQGYPGVFGKLQADQEGMPEDYFSEGLRRLRIRDEPAYRQCVFNLADAIHTTWNEFHTEDPYGNPDGWSCTIPSGPMGQLGPSIPNEFGLGNWKEAAGPEGFFPGPEVVNFIFAAKAEKPPRKRYGPQPGQWRPYLPPSPTTISEYAERAVRKRQTFKFREIPVNHPDIEQDLAGARERKNLTLVVADPESLTLPALSRVRKHDELAWEGTAVLLPCDDPQIWQDPRIQAEVQVAFPNHILVAGGAYPGRIGSSEELESKLDSLLGELHSAVLKSMAKTLPVTDAAPTQLAATTETKPA